MSDLNETERRVLEALVEESDMYGHDFGITEDVELPRGVTPAQFSGYMSQLVQKGYVTVENDTGAQGMDGSKLPDQFVLTRKALVPLHLRSCFGQDPDKCDVRCETCDEVGACEMAWEEREERQ